MTWNLDDVGIWQWNLSDNPDGYSSGSWQNDDHELVIGEGWMREIEVSLDGFEPLNEDARTAQAWIGITQATGTGMDGAPININADLNQPLSWPRIVLGTVSTFRVSMVVFHASASFHYVSRTYSPS
jgi:hypothetical protein